uniref:Uncharacterized protein n=1 Tax=Anopheles funestus TaxID=62324 RepID=A0A182RLY9_ANOFN
VKGVSLNSQLLTGPDEMASLFGVLIRFREGNICVTGDIKEMFHQVPRCSANPWSRIATLKCITTHSKAVNPIIKQHYVDDYLDSFFSINEAIETTRQVIEVHENGGFHIRNFTSNKKELLDSIPCERRQALPNVVTIEEKDTDIEKILG